VLLLVLSGSRRSKCIDSRRRGRVKGHLLTLCLDVMPAGNSRRLFKDFMTKTL
jgi:hypothetical protein